MKLIDSSEFIKNLTLDTSKGFYGEFMDGSEVAYTSREIDAAVENAPTIDAVSVVRCHECINHSYIDGEHYCKFWWAACPDDSDFFCKAGQRREADHDKDPSDPV